MRVTGQAVGMDEECQKTKEGERMKTKSQEVVERTEEERVLKKTQTWWLTGGDSRRGQCTQTWTAGTCSEGNIKCYKGGGGCLIMLQLMRAVWPRAPRFSAVSSILYETSVTLQYYRECASVRECVHFAKPPWKVPVPPGAGSTGPVDCCLTG